MASKSARTRKPAVKAAATHKVAAAPKADIPYIVDFDGNRVPLSDHSPDPSPDETYIITLSGKRVKRCDYKGD